MPRWFLHNSTVSVICSVCNSAVPLCQCQEPGLQGPPAESPVSFPKMPPLHTVLPMSRLCLPMPANVCTEAAHSQECWCIQDTEEAQKSSICQPLLHNKAQLPADVWIPQALLLCVRHCCCFSLFCLDTLRWDVCASQQRIDWWL